MVDVTGWFLTGTTFLVIILFILWRQSIKNRIHLASLLALVLIDENEFIHQKQAFTLYLTQRKSISEDVLLGEVTNGLTQIAISITSTRGDNIRNRLWKINRSV